MQEITHSYHRSEAPSPEIWGWHRGSFGVEHSVAEWPGGPMQPWLVPLRRSNLAQDKPAERNSIRSGLMSTLKSSSSTWASLASIVNDGSCSPASNRAIAG